VDADGQSPWISRIFPTWLCCPWALAGWSSAPKLLGIKVSDRHLDRVISQTRAAGIGCLCVHGVGQIAHRVLVSVEGYRESFCCTRRGGRMPERAALPATTAAVAWFMPFLRKSRRTPLAGRPVTGEQAGLPRGTIRLSSPTLRAALGLGIFIVSRCHALWQSPSGLSWWTSSKSRPSASIAARTP
jgi:hypothetical protein